MPRPCPIALLAVVLAAAPAQAYGGGPIPGPTPAELAAAQREVGRFGPELKLTYGDGAFAALAGGRGLLHFGLGDGPYLGGAGYLGGRLTGPGSPAEIAYGGAVFGWEGRLAPGIGFDLGLLAGLLETPIAGAAAKELLVAVEPGAAVSWQLWPGVRAGVGAGYLFAFGPSGPGAATIGLRLDFKRLMLLLPAD